jgi:hypothetical protein
VESKEERKNVLIFQKETFFFILTVLPKKKFEKMSGKRPRNSRPGGGGGRRSGGGGGGSRLRSEYMGKDSRPSYSHATSSREPMTLTGHEGWNVLHSAMQEATTGSVHNILDNSFNGH